MLISIYIFIIYIAHTTFTQGRRGDDILRQRALRVDRTHFFTLLFCHKKLLILYKMFIFKNDLTQNTDLTEGRKEEGAFPKRVLRGELGEGGEKEGGYARMDFPA